MDRGRLEAFSDGVLAIVITIMVLELPRPDGGDWHAFFGTQHLGETLIAYIVSFVYVGIYWNNHHHLLKTTHHVTASIMWSNLLLLFWLTLLPFATGWVGEYSTDVPPTVFYNVVLLGAAMSYFLLQYRIVLAHGGWDTDLGQAIGRDRKGWTSLALYLVALPVAFVNPHISQVLFVVVAVIWFIPDRRLEPVAH
ncbi:MAG TPA: TMEM175 family protein [Candidatus Nanopelagicales bacterium]|nr:TMEM175 family protein [Candidatus Nanopelagicales bacterium]